MTIESTSDANGFTWVWRETRPLQSFVTLVVACLVLTPAGLGAVALGSATFEVSCQRDQVMRCTLVEGYLFGLARLTHTLGDVREVSLVGVGDEGATALQLSGPTASVRTSVISTSLERSKLRALVKAVRARLPGPSFVERQSMFALWFLLFGAVMSLLWGLCLWGLVSLPVALLWPRRLLFDRGNNALLIRNRPAWPFQKAVASRAVREVRLTRNPGGPFGAFVARPRPEVSPPPLHVELALEDGAAHRFVNADQTPDADVVQFGQSVARALGRPCRVIEEGWSPATAKVS